MNTYSQSTGKWILANGKTLGVGYSGHGEGRNNPAMQAVKNVGPIPVGNYTIGEAFMHPLKGPLVMRLIPSEHTDELMRSGFLIHGDNKAMNKSASEGCIVLPHDVRLAISKLEDRSLWVVIE